MWIACWKCGQDLWLETQKICRHCDAPAHRCLDCVNYDPDVPRCLSLLIDLDPEESANPSRLSLSVSCSDYQISEAALETAHAHEGEPHHHAAPVATPAAPATGTPAAAPPPSAVTPPSAPPGVAVESDEFITVRREPPLKRPAQPVVIAHRGESSSAPENTLSAFAGAIASGANGIELDVHLTRDSVPVVIHDATVERCTNGKGRVADLSLDQIRDLDAGSWFADLYEGERVPTLEEAIVAIPAPTFIVMHLRDHENESDRCERALLDAIHTGDCRRRTLVTHHTRHGLQRLREMDPKLRLCWIPYGDEPGEEYVDDAYYLGCRFLQPRLKEVTADLVAYAHGKGMWINVFWADEMADMERMVALGVDGIITNYPRRLRDIIRQG